MHILRCCHQLNNNRGSQPPLPVPPRVRDSFTYHKRRWLPRHLQRWNGAASRPLQRSKRSKFVLIKMLQNIWEACGKYKLTFALPSGLFFHQRPARSCFRPSSAKMKHTHTRQYLVGTNWSLGQEEQPTVKGKFSKQAFGIEQWGNQKKKKE